MKTIIYEKFKFHITHAPSVCGVLFLTIHFIVYFNLTFPLLKILYVLGKRYALGRWDLNQQQKENKESLLWFHKSVSMLLELLSFPFGSFTVVFPGHSCILTFSLYRLTALSALIVQLVHLVIKHIRLSSPWVILLLTLSRELFSYLLCCHFQNFRLGFFFCPPHQPHICCYCLYLIQLFVFSVESLSSCSVA